MKGEYRKAGEEGNWGGSQRQKTVEGDYRKAGVEGNWEGKVRDRRQWREITGRREWRGTGEGKSETEDSGGRLQEGRSGWELGRQRQTVCN